MTELTDRANLWFKTLLSDAEARVARKIASGAVDTESCSDDTARVIAISVLADIIAEQESVLNRREKSDLKNLSHF